ncbi:MAG: hypothetical protein MI866_12730 [Bacteroidales bacterium]|nr:hypothetical protein [Bacteroidales bacterium]
MKKLMILMLVIMAWGCEEKDILLYPTIEESGNFNISTSGFDEMVVIPVSEINNAINDVSDGASINEVILEAIWVEITPKQGNTATKVSMDLSIQSWNTQEFINVVEGFEVSIGNEPSKVAIIQGLQQAGIDELKLQLNEIATGNGWQDVVFETEGVVTPPGGVINVDVEVFVRGTLVYAETI